MKWKYTAGGYLISPQNTNPAFASDGSPRISGIPPQNRSTAKLNLLYRARPTNTQPMHSYRTTHRQGTRISISLLSLLAALTAQKSQSVFAQGCIPIRNNPGTCLMTGGHQNMEPEAGDWLGIVGYRFFQSGRHFSGDQETRNAAGQTRIEAGTQVINTVHSFDVAATYTITPRWNASFDVPFIEAERSSLYEHGATINGQKRFSMKSGGLGDMRLYTDVWLLDPTKHMDGNIALGIGMSMPTGDDAASDISHRTTGNVVRPVDQSIQPGSGGWGIILEMQGFQKVYGNLFAYGTLSYTITPEEMTETEAPNADKGSPTSPTRFNSIPDQYLARFGFSYVVWPEHGLSLSFGGRLEGVPAYDAVGGSLGFRRPGYIVSIEPGISWIGKKNSFAITTPISEYINRVRSAPEELTGAKTGDSAFADYSILATFTHRF
jgi:hypothetical protein